MQDSSCKESYSSAAQPTSAAQQTFVAQLTHQQCWSISTHHSVGKHCWLISSYHSIGQQCGQSRDTTFVHLLIAAAH